MSVTYRYATYEDLPLVMRARYAFLEECVQRDPAYGEGVTQRTLDLLEFRTREWLLDPHVAIRLAEDGDEVVGYAVLKGSERIRISCTPCTLAPGLWVRPEHRKGPVGLQLLRWLLRASQASGSDVLQLQVMESNSDMLSSLERCGYNPVARTYEIPVQRAV